MATPEDLEVLCKWAAGLARAEAVLDVPISYDESPLRHITTIRVGAMAKGYLGGITLALAWKGNSAKWYSDQYWDNMLQESTRELTALRDAVFAQALGKQEAAAAPPERPTAMQMTFGEETS